MTTTKLRFSTAEFVFEHRRAPRGFGSWAFRVWRGTSTVLPDGTTLTAAERRIREASLAAPVLDDVYWVHQARYADAKRAAIRFAREHGADLVEVLS
jgi:hypothetical protein